MVSWMLQTSRMVNVMVTIGDRIRHYRRRLNLTQKELAQKVGVSTGTIGMYETNKREPDLQMLRRLAEVLEVTVGELVAGAEGGESHAAGKIAFHHTDRRHDPSAPIRDSLRERIRKIQEELYRIADELGDVDP